MWLVTMMLVLDTNEIGKEDLCVSSVAVSGGEDGTAL